MGDVTVRQYDPSDLEPCRELWVELTQHHRHIYEDPSIGGGSPGSHFDKHLARVGPDQLWLAERYDRVVGLVGLIVEG